jgi:hypothetical protein
MQGINMDDGSSRVIIKIIHKKKEPNSPVISGKLVPLFLKNLVSAEHSAIK